MGGCAAKRTFMLVCFGQPEAESAVESSGRGGGQTVAGAESRLKSRAAKNRQDAKLAAYLSDAVE